VPTQVARWTILSLLSTPLDWLSSGDHLLSDPHFTQPVAAQVSGEIVDEQVGGGALAQLECAYRNSSDRMVILRCLGPNAFFLERVVFPFELLSFACPPESEVEILTHSLGGPELLESMPARILRLDPPLAPLDVSHDLGTEVEPWLQAG
jgi:hypothetical protein